MYTKGSKENFEMFTYTVTKWALLRVVLKPLAMISILMDVSGVGLTRHLFALTFYVISISGTSLKPPFSFTPSFPVNSMERY